MRRDGKRGTGKEEKVKKGKEEERQVSLVTA